MYCGWTQNFRFRKIVHTSFQFPPSPFLRQQKNTNSLTCNRERHPEVVMSCREYPEMRLSSNDFRSSWCCRTQRGAIFPYGFPLLLPV